MIHESQVRVRTNSILYMQVVAPNFRPQVPGRARSYQFGHKCIQPFN